MLVNQLGDLGRGSRLGPVLCGKLDDAARVTPTIVVFGAALIFAEKLDCGIALDSILLACGLVCSATKCMN
jgi:hypothetical protein